jgi:hypothetical protein
MKIEIYTCLAPTSVPFAENLKRNLEQLKSGRHTLLYRTIGNDKFGPLRVEGWDHKENVNVDLPPSASHATALNQIVNHIEDDTTYVVVADCDIMILQRDWDERLIGCLLKNNVDCVGTPKFCGVLSVYFTLYKAEVFKAIRPNFMPGNETTISVPWYTLTDPREAACYGMVVGDKLVQDTGWRVPRQLVEAGCTYKLLEYYQNHQATDNLVFNYLLNKKLFVTHFSGSHKRPFEGAVCRRWVEGANTYNQKAAE